MYLEERVGLRSKLSKFYVQPNLISLSSFRNFIPNNHWLASPASFSKVMEAKHVVINYWRFSLKSSITVGRCPAKVRMSKLETMATFDSDHKSPTPVQTEYKDNWFEKLAINHLSRNLQIASGKKSEKNGYEGLIEASCMISKNFSQVAQQELVSRCLGNCIPRPFLSLMKIMMPQSKFLREFFAASTTLLFSWLVGLCEVRDSELHGRREKNVVYIKKCRYLEATNCAGMCINLCKMPTQKFIREELGIPIHMVPNFENMSCEMIFGQIPPDEGDDPAVNQPCYLTLCKAKKMHRVDCSSEVMEG